MTPEKIGRYQILGEIGRGAMGIVYRAFDPNIGRNIAIKTIPLDPSNPELGWRFRREAQAAGILSHPNIVTIYDAGADEGVLYIAMELVEGETLQQILTRGPLPVDQVLSLAKQVGAALDHAHSHEIIHRDIKPANVIVRQGTAKVTDFGVAKLNVAVLTSTGQVLGTPSYLAPEVVKGEVADRRSDIFSFGVVLYEMLTGARPFAGENISTVIYRILCEPPPAPTVVNSSLPRGMNYVVLKVLAKNPALRYQNCAELVADLKNYEMLADQGKSAVRFGSTAAVRASSPVSETMALDRAAIKPTLKAVQAPPSFFRRKSAWAAAAVASIALVAGIVWQARRTGELPSLAPGQPVVTTPSPPTRAPQEKPTQAAATPASGRPSAQSAAPRPEALPPPLPSRTPTRQVPGAMGRLVIHTEPAGARILLNGQPTEYRSPVNLPLAAGRYEITVEREGFASATKEVVVPENSAVEVRIEMERAGGILRRLPFRR